jgi:hypothetical protein
VSKLEQDLAAARRDVETQTALAAKADAEASPLRKTADAGTADLKSLQQERDRSSRLEQDLAATKRDLERQATLAAKASAEAARLKAAESGSAELRQSLQQEHDKVAQLERDLALARSKENAPVASVASADRTRMQNEAEAS